MANCCIKGANCCRAWACEGRERMQQSPCLRFTDIAAVRLFCFRRFLLGRCSCMRHYRCFVSQRVYVCCWRKRGWSEAAGLRHLFSTWRHRQPNGCDDASYRLEFHRYQKSLSVYIYGRDIFNDPWGRSRRTPQSSYLRYERATQRA